MSTSWLSSIHSYGTNRSLFGLIPGVEITDSFWTLKGWMTYLVDGSIGHSPLILKCALWLPMPLAQLQHFAAMSHTYCNFFLCIDNDSLPEP